MSHAADRKDNSNIADQTGHPRQPLAVNHRRLTLLMTIFLFLAIAASLIMVWQFKNRQTASKLTGDWYCASEGIQYQFREGGVFVVTNGQSTLLEGQWQSGWKSGSLVLSYGIDGQENKQAIAYTLSDDAQKLVLHNIQAKDLQMTRLP